MTLFHLYIDDSGTRRPDRKVNPPRADGVDHFALGGILINEEDISKLLDAHSSLLERWGLDVPLHSTRIRGRRGNFAWLGENEQTEAKFLADLERTLLALRVLGIACVIDRPGYRARYSEKYPEPWLLCKTAFAILVERSAKYAQRRGGRLKIYFEEAGRAEDRAIESYVKSLKTEGMPFAADTSGQYEGLKPDEFKKVIVGTPNRITKKAPMVQVADMLLYPIVKGGYDETYGPYCKLVDAKRLIDAELSKEDVPKLGIKYSCFAGKK
jgi:hypothetical protein